MSVSNSAAWLSAVGSLALIGFPGTSGFFSKDALVDAVGMSQRFGSGYGYFCTLTSVFVTALYTFRMFFMTFHGEERMDHHTKEHFREPMVNPCKHTEDSRKTHYNMEVSYNKICIMHSDI